MAWPARGLMWGGVGWGGLGDVFLLIICRVVVCVTKFEVNGGDLNLHREVRCK